MSEELKPCPFCGGEAFVNDDPLGTSNETINMKGNIGIGRLWSIECDECGADAGYAQSVEEARRRWNRRAERACNVESSHVEQEIGYYAYLGVELSCGHAFTWDDGTPPDYCPYCGARVIEEES